MNRINRTIALALLTSAALALPVAQAEVMKHVEKMFQKHDTKKKGKLDKAQAEQFLKDLMNYGGA